MNNQWGKVAVAGLMVMLSACTSATSVISADGYDRHVELNWDSVYSPDKTYVVKASIDGGDWVERAVTSGDGYLDYVGDQGRNLTVDYKLFEQRENGLFEVGETTAETRDFSDEELIDMVQKYTFRYFWDNAHQETGWAYERIPNPKDGDIITSGGTGFGIMSVIVGAERGWITRDQAVKRMETLVSSLEALETFHGMWAHWYDASTEEVFHFSKYDDGGDIVESAFMAQGLLAARQYFNAESTEEAALRERITGLWQAMEWDWYTQGENVLYWHWSKEHGWKMDHPIHGYNEALIVYVLAASSPTHAIDPAVYHEGWASWDSPTFGNYNDYYGMALPLGNKKHMGGPLFFAHYSFLGLDPRNLRDSYANYWEQNKRHTLINRAYCIDNPLGWEGYGEDFWGLTAGDRVPAGYAAHAPGFRRDEGTITVTAALSSLPYTPEESMEVLKNLYYNHGKELFGTMGFYDGINLSVSDDPKEQVRKTYLAIDQGPIVAMLENYRTGLLWEYFMRDEDVQKGLKRLGFSY